MWINAAFLRINVFCIDGEGLTYSQSTHLFLNLGWYPDSPELGREWEWQLCLDSTPSMLAAAHSAYKRFMEVGYWVWYLGDYQIFGRISGLEYPADRISARLGTKFNFRPDEHYKKNGWISAPSPVISSRKDHYNKIVILPVSLLNLLLVCLLVYAEQFVEISRLGFVKLGL